METRTLWFATAPSTDHLDAYPDFSGDPRSLTVGIRADETASYDEILADWRRSLRGEHDPARELVESAGTVGGRRAVVFEDRHACEPRSPSFDVWGCEGCIRRHVLVRWRDRVTIIVSTRAGGPDAWARYASDVRALEGSLASAPQHSLSPALDNFLRARIHRIGLRPWISSAALSRLDMSGAYALVKGERDLTGFTVERVTPLRGGRARFDVWMEANGRVYGAQREAIVIGPGIDADGVVRDAIVLSVRVTQSPDTS